MKRLWISVILILSLGLLGACQKQGPVHEEENQEEIELQNTYLYINTFKICQTYEKIMLWVIVIFFVCNLRKCSFK